MVERLLGFTMLQTEHDMYGQCGSSGSTQRVSRRTARMASRF
ncbi:MAG: hypothetical protein ACLSDM_01740 [Butyricicoccus sp.]